MAALEIMENILESLQTDSDFSLWLNEKVGTDFPSINESKKSEIKNYFFELIEYTKKLFPSSSHFSIVAESYIDWSTLENKQISKIQILDIFWQKVVAFSVIYYRQKLIFYTAKKLIYPSMAEDVVQDSFRKLSQATPGSILRNVLGWLYRTCSNRAFDVNKKEERKSLVDNSVMEKIIPDKQESPFNALITGENSKLLKDALDEILNGTQRNLLRLKYEDDLSSKEIAEIMGLSESYVRKATCLTFISLRKKIPEWFKRRQ